MAAPPMEAQTAQPPSDPSSAYPRWVMLEQALQIQADEVSPRSTAAAARTSAGHLIQVCLRLAKPPAASCVCLRIPHDDGLDAKYPVVVAAHGDSVLIQVTIEEKDPQSFTTDRFVYNAGAAAADPPRPPSLALLPLSPLSFHGTGLLRRGESDLVVAQLRPRVLEAEDGMMEGTPGAEELTRGPELFLLRSGEWSVKRPAVRFPDAGAVRQLRTSWDAVVPVDDRRLCWVDLWRCGVLLCDVFDEEPVLQYLPLPTENLLGPRSNRNVCAAGGALKFVNIFPRCCCGGAGASGCQRSLHAYTINTWTMRIGSADDDMRWVKDGVVDATELWELDAYQGLPRFPLKHPVVSLDEPELICFRFHEPRHNDSWHDGCTQDLLMVNMRSKTIHSVSRLGDEWLDTGESLIPSRVSYFFNSYPSDGALSGERHKDSERPPAPAVVVDGQLIRDGDEAGSLTPQPSSFAEPSVQESEEIFEAFQEIPSYGLDQDELVKVYRILSLDNCRRFRSLSMLPKNLRKDWLLMEIKASED